MTLKTQGLQSLEQIRIFLEGAQPLGFTAPSREAAYEWSSGSEYLKSPVTTQEISTVGISSTLTP